MGETWKVIRRESWQNLDALSVLNLRAMDLGFKHQALGVHQEMSLMTFDLLASVVTSLSSYTCGLYRLRIHYARAGLGISLEALSQTMAQCGV
jgi:hypothetical protein